MYECRVECIYVGFFLTICRERHPLHIVSIYPTYPYTMIYNRQSIKKGDSKSVCDIQNTLL